MQIMFFNYRSIKLGMNDKKITRPSSNILKLTNTILNNSTNT